MLFRESCHALSMFQVDGQWLLHHHMDTFRGALLHYVQVPIDSIESGNSLWLSIFQHFFKGVEDNIHAKAMLLSVAFRQITVGFGDAYDLYIAPGFAAKYPVHMGVYQAHYSNPEWRAVCLPR